MRKTRIIAAVGAALLALSAASCSSEGSKTSDSSTSEKSVTIKHAFGETTVEGTPKRVATLGWGNHEVPLSLGIVPVGMSKATFGDDDGNGILPWVEEKLKELGGEQPVLFDESDGVPFEQVADTKPDVILAAYSGLTQEDYDKLSKIAPVVAPPGAAWETSLKEMTLMDSKGLNKAKEGEQLEKDLNKLVEDTMAQYPELKGKNALFTSFGSAKDSNSLGFYTTDDPRAGFLKDAGFGVPKVVTEGTKDAKQFWTERSLEKPEAFADVDFIISYGSDDAEENEKALKRMQEDPLFNKIEAIKEGRVVFLGEGPLAAAANPSPLAMKAKINDYFAKINEAITR